MMAPLLVACLLTMALETTFFALFRGTCRWDFLALCLAVNMTTNLTLNTVLLFTGRSGSTVYLLEMVVVAVEYGVYALGIGGSRKLFFQTLAANILSYTLGGLLFGLV